jgi:hypothetical protein
MSSMTRMLAMLSAGGVSGGTDRRTAATNAASWYE